MSPKRLKRLKTALGIGPYKFDTRLFGKKNEERLSLAAMLYANFYLSENTSIRGFDALVKEQSLFNNFGLYFAYLVGQALDNKIEVVPLLGLQALSFKFNDEHSTIHKLIFPQGVEIIYKHAFGLKNYSLVYGMFLNPSSREKYKNLWVRFGSGFFWELNLIEWELEEKFARMWGLSIGIPWLGFF